MKNPLKLILLALSIISTYNLFGADIPSLYITTSDSSAITSRDYWKKGTHLRIVMPNGETSYESSAASIKARGNSTFSKPKKPFALKLDKPAALLGMEAGDNWILLANFMDHSNMRNSLALEISKQTSLDYTCDSRFVDVYVNGKLQGCYLLSQSAHLISSALGLDSEDGFLIESDSYPSEKYHFNTSIRHLPINVKYPENVSDSQMLKIEQYFNDLEKILYSEEDLTPLYQKYIDMDSFVDWWIIQELTQNAEPNGPRSCYMHKDKNGLLKAGPIWDYDLAFVSLGLDKGGDIRPSRITHLDVKKLDGDSLYNPTALWYERLIKDARFKERIKSRWNELKPRFLKLADTLDMWRSQIDKSALADNKLWFNQDPAKFDIYPTFHESADNLKRVYLYRIESLDKIFSQF